MAKRRDDSYEPMRRLLRAYQVDGPTMASAIGCCINTARSRLQTPGTLTYDELRRICIGCGVPADEIREALRFGR